MSDDLTPSPEQEILEMLEEVTRPTDDDDQENPFHGMILAIGKATIEAKASSTYDNEIVRKRIDHLTQCEPTDDVTRELSYLENLLDR